MAQLASRFSGIGQAFQALDCNGAQTSPLPQVLQRGCAWPTLQLAMFSLTRQEQVLIILVLLSLLIGAAVKHYRRVYNETHPVAAPTPTPSLRSKDLYYTPR